MSRVPPFNDKQTWFHNDDYEGSRIFDFNNTYTVANQLQGEKEIHLTSRLHLQNQATLGTPTYLRNQFHPRADESTRFKDCTQGSGYNRNEMHPKFSAGNLNTSSQDTSHWYQPRIELGHSDVESRWNQFNEERGNPVFGSSSMKWHDYRNRTKLLPIMMSEEITRSEELDRNAYALSQHWQSNQLKTRRQLLESNVYMQSDEPFSNHFSRLADQGNSDGMEYRIKHRGRSFKGLQPSSITVPTDDRTDFANQSNIELPVPMNAKLPNYLSYINCNRVVSHEQNRCHPKLNDRHILECLDKVSPKTLYHNDTITSILNQNFDSDLVDFAKDEITGCIEHSQMLHGVAKQNSSRMAIMVPNQGTSSSCDHGKQWSEMRARLPIRQHLSQDTRFDKQHICSHHDLQVCSNTLLENDSKSLHCSSLQLPTSCNKASSVKTTKKLKETKNHYLSSSAKVHKTLPVHSGSVIPRTLHIVTPTSKPLANDEPESSHYNKVDKSTEEYEAALVLQCLHESMQTTKIELDHSSMINSNGNLFYLNATSTPNDDDVDESKFKKQTLIKEEVPAVLKRKRGRPPKTQLDPWSRLQLDIGDNDCLPELKDRVPPWDILVPDDSMFGQIEDRDELYMADDDENDEFWKFRNLHGPDKQFTVSIYAKVRSLVDPSFDGLFVAMAQMIPCKLTVDDQNCGITSYKSLSIGFNGLACRHCGGRAGSGRYFPSTVRCLSQTTTAQNMIKHFINASVIVPDVADLNNSNEKTNHVKDSMDAISSNKSGKAYCTNCPHSVWLWLTEFQKRLLEDKDTLRNQNDIGPSDKGSSHRVKYGARKVFYAKVWKRIHKIAYDEH